MLQNFTLMQTLTQKTSILAIALIISTLWVACKKDKAPCKDVTCPVNSTCIEGSCECDLFYEGATCTENTLLTYLGTYRGIEYYNQKIFDITVQLVHTSDSVNILSFEMDTTRYFDYVDLEFTSLNEFEIPTFSFTPPLATQSITGNGSGIIRNDSIIGTIQYDSWAGIIDANFEFGRQ